MSLQTIINNAVTIKLDRRKISGQTISRAGHVKISSIASNIPWMFSVEMHQGLRYSDNRNLVEELDRIDRVHMSTINIGGSNPGLSYITEYLGEASPNQLAGITFSSYSGMTLTLNGTLSGIPSNRVVFKKGDFIQLAGNKYPYTVTADVVRGSAGTFNVPINRPFINQAGYSESGKGIVVGNNVTWQVVLTQRPAYRIVPWNRIEFDGAFEFIEVIED